MAGVVSRSLGLAVRTVSRRGVHVSAALREKGNDMPDPIDHATGVEKYELLAREAGNDDPFYLKSFSRGEATKDEPCIVMLGVESQSASCPVPTLDGLNSSAAEAAVVNMVTCLQTNCEDADPEGMLKLVKLEKLLSLGASCTTFPQWTEQAQLGGCTAKVGMLTEVIKVQPLLLAMVPDIANLTVPEAASELTIQQLCPFQCCTCRTCVTTASPTPEAIATTEITASGAQRKTELAFLGMAFAAVVACANSFAIGLQL